MSRARPVALRPALGLLFLVAAAGIVAAGAPQPVDADYADAIAEYRTQREERLRSEDGWLTLTGLFWLEPGENDFGSDESNPVVLAAEAIPARAGQILVDGETVRVRAADGTELRLDGEPIVEAVLGDDTAEHPDVLTLGRLRFHVIRRGDRFGVRVKDPQHPRRTGFHGLDHFPLDPAYRIDAAFRPYEQPHEVEILTVVGTRAKMLAPGVVEFTLGGRKHALQALISEPGETSLWLIFKDETSGRESYGFRYLYADLADGRVDLDFNRAYNPPCAFTPYATCPLPPRRNWLEARVEAGERVYGDH